MIYARLIPGWQATGYHVKLIFLALPSAAMAIARVTERGAPRGHNVQKELIQRRFSAGLANFEILFRDLVDSWVLYDNAGDEPQLIDWSEKA